MAPLTNSINSSFNTIHTSQGRADTKTYPPSSLLCFPSIHSESELKLKMYPPSGCVPESLGPVWVYWQISPQDHPTPQDTLVCFFLKFIELFQALEKAQSDFDRLQEKLERCQNDSRRVSQFCPSCLLLNLQKYSSSETLVVKYTTVWWALKLDLY